MTHQEPTALSGLAPAPGAGPAPGPARAPGPGPGPALAPAAAPSSLDPNDSAAVLLRLVESYRQSIVSYMARCGVDAASRADLLQEILLKLHRAAPQGLPAQGERVWVFTVAANTVRSFFRRMAVQRRVIADGGDASLTWLDRATDAPSSQEIAEAREVAQWLAGALTRLPLLEREVIVLHGLQGLNQKEVAQVLGIPVGSVKTHVRRARLALAKELARVRSRIRREVAP